MENNLKNKELVHRSVEEIWNGARYEKMDEFVSRDFIVHMSSPDQVIQGAKNVQEFFTEFRNAFPDIHFTIATGHNASDGK